MIDQQNGEVVPEQCILTKSVTIRPNIFYNSFVKFEDSRRLCKPHIAYFDTMPAIDLNGNLANGIFRVCQKVRENCKMQMNASYCECCHQSYTKLREHLNCDKHKKFAETQKKIQKT